MTYDKHLRGSVENGISRSMARFILNLDSGSIPDDVMEKARTCVLYGFGMGLLCVNQATAQSSAQACFPFDGSAADGGATTLVSGETGPISTAVFSNAVLLHSRCQEDTSGTAHLGVIVLTVAFALLEAGLGSKDSFVPAIVAGYEIAGALEATLGRDTMASGLRASSLYGSIAAAATAARMLEFPLMQIDAALANAASFSGGTLQSILEGTDEWRYQVGIAARTGLLSAGLARAGSISAGLSFEGQKGFSRAFAAKALDFNELQLGEKWRLPMVAFKPYPICAHNQAPALVAARVHDEFDVSTIEQLRIRINPYVVPGMLEKGPFTRVSETLLSTYFCCAQACIYGTISLPQLSRFSDIAVQELIQRISVECDPNIPYPSAAADVTTKNGTTTLSESKSFSDFSLTRSQVNEQLLRIAAEEGLATQSIDLIDGFAFNLPSSSPAEIVQAYVIARSNSPKL